MSLVICSECGKEFSDKAAACPNCGCPTQEISIMSNNINSFDDVFNANVALRALNGGAIKISREIVSQKENVLFSSILNISVSPNFGKLNNKFSTSGVMSGVLTITERRLMFVHSAGGIGDRKEIAIKDITSIDSKHSLVNCPIRVQGITDMFVIDCNKQTQQKILNALGDARAKI